MNDVTKNLLQLELKTFQDQLALIEPVIIVISNFDGKQFNKRLDTALKNKVSDRLRISQSYNTMYIYYYPKENTVKSGEFSVKYITDHSTRSLMATAIESCYRSKDENLLIDNKINATAWIKAINSYKVAIERNIKNIKDLLKNEVKLKKEKEKIEKLKKEYNDKISWIADYYCNLRVK